MNRSDDPFRFDSAPLQAWLGRIVAESQTLLDHLVERVDRLVDDVVRDVTEVARSATDLFDEWPRGVHEDDGAGESADARPRAERGSGERSA